MTTSRKITMAELALRAGVDVSTVSRALNGSPLVREETRAQILKMAEETGYAVNASARNLRRQSSEAIGIVIPLRPGSGQTLSDPFFLEMVGAVSDAATQRGLDLIISAPKDDEQIAEKRLLQSGKADGLILIGQAGRSKRLEALGGLADKVVVWGGQSGDAPYTLVGSDNREGGRLATAHLLEQGCRSILFMGPRALPEVALRYEGFVSAHREAGLSPDPALAINVEFGAKSAFDDMLAAMDSGLRFDGVFAASDVLAMSALLALRARDRRVPEDVAVVGYDNITQSAMTTPALTTVDQAIDAGGRLMVELLLRKLAGEEVASAFTPTRLVVRGSSVRGGADDQT